MNPITHNPTLSDLISRGLVIRNQRITEEKVRIAALNEKLAREREEREREIRAILPAPLDELAEVDAGMLHAHVYVKKPFPGEGKVVIYASKKDEQWHLLEFAAYNPDGYYLKFQTLEEALAFAAGALEI